ncbi:MAG: hypothetical protein LAO03_19865 [Acidobacteriia bacterium]|nr:hypothetical protein [Terriglobia bacterium]
MEKPKYLGLGVVLGAGIGAAMMTATHMPAWLAIGTGVGLAIGSAIANRKQTACAADSPRQAVRKS